MKNKHGFSPIVIIIGLTIGSMVSLIVMNSISQLTKTLSRVTTLTRTDTAAVLGLHVLEQDFSSACMPEYIHYQEKDEKAKQEQTKYAKKEKKKEFFKKAFVIKQSQGLLEECWCVSMYTINKDHVVPKKVKYTLEESSGGDAKLYTLYRQEYGDLNSEKSDSKGDKKFIVMKNIVSLNYKLWAQPLPPEKDTKGAALKPEEKKQKKEEKKRIPYKSFTEWDSDKNSKEDSQKNDERLPMLPDFIDITLIVQEEKGKEKTYSTSIMMPWGFPELTLTGVVPIVHEKKEKDQQTPQEQLSSLSKNADLSGTLNDKVNQLANTMSPGQKEQSK